MTKLKQIKTSLKKLLCIFFKKNKRIRTEMEGGIYDNFQLDDPIRIN